MSVAFVREESAETAAEVELPARPISPHPNLVTASGLNALNKAMTEARAAYDAAQRLNSAQVVPAPSALDVVAFGSRVSLKRGDGRRQDFKIVGEDEANPRERSISFFSPMARVLMGKAVGDVVTVGDGEIEIITIA